MLKFPRNLSGAWAIALGTIVGQGMVLMATPFVARLYGPSNLGEATVFLALASVLTPVISLRLELLIPSASDQEARWIARRAMMTVAVGSTIATIAYGLVSHTSSVFVLVLFWLTAGGLASIAVSAQVLVRRNSFGRVGAAKAVTGLATSSVQLTLGYISSTLRGLEAGIAAGYIFGWMVQRSGFKDELPVVAPERRRRKQIMYDGVRLATAGLLNAASLWSILFALNTFHTSTEAGIFAAVQRIILTPVGLVTASLLPVVTSSVASVVRRGGSASTVVSRWITRLAPLGIAVCVGLLMAPERIYTLLLGPEFDGAGEYVDAMALMIGAQVAAGPLGQVLVALRCVRGQFWWDLTRFASLAVVAATIGFLDLPPTSLVLGLAGVFAVSYALFLLSAYVLARRLDRRRVDGMDA